MAAKVGIRQNSRIVLIAGCKVFQDQRKNRMVGNCATIDPYTNQPNISEGTRSPLNRKASERGWRKAKWAERVARDNARAMRQTMEAAQ